MTKLVCKVVVGSRLHDTYNESSDWDYRGIHISPLKDILSPFKTLKNTSWLEGDTDNTSYEFADFCKQATKGNCTILEVLFSDKIIETSKLHKIMSKNWKKFFNTEAFIKASLGYSSNQFKKFSLYEDLGENNQPRTAKFVISFIRVLWQCEQLLKTGEFKCSLKNCDKLEFVKKIKPLYRHQLNIPECFAQMEEMYARVVKAQAQADKNILELKPDINWIENLIEDVYKNPERYL